MRCAPRAASSAMRRDAMYIGRRLPRVEDARLLTGRGRYADDETCDGEAWCAFVRSPHARARIVSIDAAATQKLPGVLGVLTGADYAADGLQPIDHVPNPLDVHDIQRRAFDSPKQWPQWPLATGKVRHVGEPLALVIADSAERARDAAERMEVEYQPLPLEETVCFDYAFGDSAAASAALARSVHVVRHEFAIPRVVN